MRGQLFALLLVALAACPASSNPAERVLNMVGELKGELDTESSARIAAFKTEEKDCKQAEVASRAKVDSKDAEVRALLAKIAEQEKAMEVVAEHLRKLQAEAGASEVIVSMNVERLKGIVNNIALANKTAHAAAEQHTRKMGSLQKSYGVTQTLIQFIKRAFEHQANAKVHPAPGMVPDADAASLPARDTTNPKEVGVRGALDAASSERNVGGDASADDLHRALNFEKDDRAPDASEPAASTMSFKRVFSNVFAAKGPLASHRHTRTAQDLLAAIDRFQNSGRSPRRTLLEDPSDAMKRRHKQSSRIYELMVSLSQNIKLEHDSELDSNARTVAAGDKLMRALLKQRATIQAVLLKEAAKNLKHKVETAEKEISDKQKVIKEDTKQLEAVREHLMRLTTDLDDQSQKCKGISNGLGAYEDETAKQNRIMGEISTIIQDRVAKVKELVDKNIKAAAGLIHEASTVSPSSP